MEVLDYLDLSTIEPKYVAQAVQKYINDRKDMISTLDVTIRVSICKTQKTARAGKEERQEVLAQLIEITGIAVWSEQIYSFGFKTGKYLWGKKEIHVTAGEAVALYQKLVRKQDSDTWGVFYANMKNKLGVNFLEGVV